MTSRANSFRLSGRIEVFGPLEFLAVASAVASGETEAVLMETQLEGSMQAAQRALDALMHALDASVRQAGGWVAEVELFGQLASGRAKLNPV